MLATYACDPARTRGRRIAEPATPHRSEYQRDRDRIVHSTAFRRLVYKTQVFVNHEGDLFRTRLTHSLEVAQLGRSIARTLGLNEDLVEAVALAHDLGHTPFGHAGQDALHACMREHGGFEHNLQSLRVVDRLEQRYPDFDGLNLCLETREGILKRCSARVAAALEVAEPGGVARRFAVGEQASLEAQLVNLADELAYNAHDIDDGVRSGLLEFEQLQAVPLFTRSSGAALVAHPSLGAQPRRLLAETLRRMLSAQVQDVISATQDQLGQHRPQSAAAVHRLPPLVRFSASMREQSAELKRFLFASLYRHPQVMRTSEQAHEVVRALFAAYTVAPAQMPAEQSSEFARRGPRVVADYVAGMTDRYATREFTRLTGQAAFTLS
ncbi:MAG: deoxyguanosinetriphosphate triphosphohydrolase [Pseudomonadota bacterium]